MPELIPSPTCWQWQTTLVVDYCRILWSLEWHEGISLNITPVCMNGKGHTTICVTQRSQASGTSCKIVECETIKTLHE